MVYVYDSVSWVLHQRAPVVRHRENGGEKEGNPGSKMAETVRFRNSNLI